MGEPIHLIGKFLINEISAVASSVLSLKYKHPARPCSMEMRTTGQVHIQILSRDQGTVQPAPRSSTQHVRLHNSSSYEKLVMLHEGLALQGNGAHREYLGGWW